MGDLWRLADSTVRWGAQARTHKLCEPQALHFPHTQRMWHTKALVLASSQEHPEPRPTTPLVLCRVLSNGTLELPEGQVMDHDEAWAGKIAPGRPYVSAGLRSIVADTNLPPDQFAIYTSRFKDTRSEDYVRRHRDRDGTGAQGPKDTYLFYKYLGEAPPPYVVTPVVELRPSAHRPWDEFVGRKGSCTWTIGRVWLPLGHILRPRDCPGSLGGDAPPLLDRDPKDGICEILRNLWGADPVQYPDRHSQAQWDRLPYEIQNLLAEKLEAVYGPFLQKYRPVGKVEYWDLPSVKSLVSPQYQAGNNRPATAPTTLRQAAPTQQARGATTEAVEVVGGDTSSAGDTIASTDLPSAATAGGLTDWGATRSSGPLVRGGHQPPQYGQPW